MRRSKRYGWNGKWGDWEGTVEHYSWAGDLPLELEEAKAEPAKATQRQKAEAGLEKVQATMRQWETKRKRAENALKKYETKRKYYERRPQAMGGE